MWILIVGKHVLDNLFLLFLPKRSFIIILAWAQPEVYQDVYYLEFFTIQYKPKEMTPNRSRKKIMRLRNTYILYHVLFFFNSIIPMILFNYRTKITVDESIKKIRVQSLTGTGNCHTFCTLWNLNVRVDFLEHSDRWTLSTSTDYWNNKWWIFPDNTLQFKQFKRYVGDSHPYVSIHCCFLVIKVEVYYGKFSGLFPC
jgi:hypothetical protein